MFLRFLLVIVFFSILASCSANQLTLKSQLIPSEHPSAFELENAISIKAEKAKTSKLNAGTRWHKFGTIEQGEVYRSKDQIVIVNSFNVHEGYIVVQNSEVVGYYLPVEKTFVQSEPTSINLIEVTE